MLAKSILFLSLASLVMSAPASDSDERRHPMISRSSIPSPKGVEARGWVSDFGNSNGNSNDHFSDFDSVRHFGNNGFNFGYDSGLNTGFDRNSNSWDFGNHRNSDRNPVRIITIERQVCRRHDFEFVQRKIIILREMIKRIILEERCSVETAVIIIENSNRNFREWTRNLQSGRASYNFEAASLGDRYFSSSSDSERSNYISSAPPNTFAAGDIVQGNVTVNSNLVANGTEVLADNAANNNTVAINGTESGVVEGAAAAENATAPVAAE